MMNGSEKSDSVIVAGKPMNKAERSAAELVEQRTGTKGNVGQLSTCRAQNRISVTQVLARIRQLSAVDTLGRSRMRESRLYGSRRGARGKPRIELPRSRAPYLLCNEMDERVPHEFEANGSRFSQRR